MRTLSCSGRRVGGAVVRAGWLGAALRQVLTRGCVVFLLLLLLVLQTPPHAQAVLHGSAHSSQRANLSGANLLQPVAATSPTTTPSSREPSAPITTGGCPTLSPGSPRPAPNTYYLGLLYDSRMPPRYHVGAISVAIEKVNSELLSGLGVRLDFYWNKTDGSKVKSIQTMTELRAAGVHGFIGPSHTACVIEATVATAWNIPLISYHCQDEIVGVVDSPPTFVRTFAPTMKIVRYIMSIMLHYGWNRTVIFYGGGKKGTPSQPAKKSPWLETVEALARTVQVVDTKVVPNPYYPNRDCDAIKKMFDETKHKTRVYIFLGDHEALIDFARHKHQTLKAEGREAEYVIIAVTERAEAPKPEDINPTFLTFEERRIRNNNATEHHITPFRNVLLLCFRAPADEDKYRYFMEASKNKSIEVFGVYNLYKIGTYRLDKLMPEASYLYDAVFLYGRTLREALNQSVDVTNGTAMIELMKDRPYDSIQGYSIHIDSSGDSMANYSVYSVTKEKLNITRIAQFTISTNNSPEYKLTASEDSIWIDQAPKTIPVCGLDGSDCIPIDWKIPVLSSIGALIAIATVAVVFLCRHYRYEQKLASLLWKVDIKDLIFTDTDFNDPMMSDKPKRRTSRSARQSVGATDEIKEDAFATKFQGIRIATNRASLVAVRFLKRRHVEVTRTMRKELHLLKEMQHDNINRFIGACIDTPNICIVTQYCSRGSLKDILENDDLHLDDMFVASLVFDLIRGMIFLHDSEIVSHGNLKSTNCLVDSRWVLQIADFGIHQLRGCELPSMVDEDEFYRRLLWRAPELLRLPVAPPAGTQKADVYSFGIILFEIHGRSGPWGPSMYSPREIVEKLKYPPDGAILRPDTSLLKCECEFVVRCMKECWREIPECRPDFKYIRMKLKPLQRGLKSNIFDNMLAIMEKYADNLEAIVAARTDQLMEEKKKTEALLLRMLPKFVAEQLKIGNPVVPEHFNCVTIYFSDVVGFTAISAESTPLEVVDMLNDLYTCFDSIIGEFDVYKVETIGDAYMVVSGLPLRNGDNHAGEVASMSLHLLRAIGNFKMRHRPNERLSLRIGIHSGSVVTGVVGLKMPRYCLFGDTVNTASRMESNGEPMKIHCSASCRNILSKLGGYVLEERGYVSMKGKGEMFTYFLSGEDKSHRLRRISVEKRPLSLDCNIFNSLTPIPNHGRLRGSTTSLRSEDSAATATESLHQLLNGNVPLLSRERSGSMESQV